MAEPIIPNRLKKIAQSKTAGYSRTKMSQELPVKTARDVRKENKAINKELNASIKQSVKTSNAASRMSAKEGKAIEKARLEKKKTIANIQKGRVSGPPRKKTNYGPNQKGKQAMKNLSESCKRVVNG
jgi:hypothetical protein